MRRILINPCIRLSGAGRSEKVEGGEGHQSKTFPVVRLADEDREGPPGAAGGLSPDGPGLMFVLRLASASVFWLEIVFVHLCLLAKSHIGALKNNYIQMHRKKLFITVFVLLIVYCTAVVSVGEAMRVSRRPESFFALVAVGARRPELVVVRLPPGAQLVDGQRYGSRHGGVLGLPPRDREAFSQLRPEP